MSEAVRRWRVIVGGLGLLLASSWIANQGGIEPVEPTKYAAMGAVVWAALPMLAVCWAGAMGYGSLLVAALLGRERRDAIAAAGLGLYTLLMAAWLLAWVGWLNRGVAWTLPSVGAAMWFVQLWRRRSQLHWPAMAHWCSLAMAGGLGLMLVAATCPPGTIWRTEALGYDVLSYHLQVPREWLAAGAMTPLEHNVFSFLPSLFEVGYLQLATMAGSMHEAIYACQLLHVSTAVLAAVAVGGTVKKWSGPTGATAAAGVMLVVPWVMITATLAYDEMAMLALAATALYLVYDEKPSGVGVGLLCAGSTLCKLTAGPFLAAPIGVVLLMRRKWRAAALAAVVGLAGLCPYFARNAAWEGNPVFPFAARQLGEGYWNDQLVDRWDRGVGLTGASVESPITALNRQWLTNTGYGAVGGHHVSIEVRNVARFDQEGGIPILWLAVAAGAVLALRRRERRGVVGQMSVMLVMQLAFWLFATHRQSRFLLPTVLPMLVVLGMGVQELVELVRGRRTWAGPFAVTALIAAMWSVSLTCLYQQTMMATNPDKVSGQAKARLNLPPCMLVDSLGRFGIHPINELPADAKVYMVADNSHLLYIDRPIIYHTPFDPSVLGEIIRRTHGDPRKVNQALCKLGVTHVWVHWYELARLHETYGYDRDVTETSLQRLIAGGWRPVFAIEPAVTLYALPRE